MKPKLLWVDLETTGLNEKIHGVWEIAALVEIDGEIKDEFHEFVSPHPELKCQKKALEVGGINKKDLITFLPETYAYQSLKHFFDKHINPKDSNDKFWFAAFNQTFDVNFLTSFWDRNKNENEWFGSYVDRRPSLDPRSIYSYLVFNGKADEPDDFKLTTIAEHVGLDVDQQQAHGAFYDINLCRDLFYYICNNFEVNARRNGYDE